jgi:hypothetical protein
METRWSAELSVQARSNAAFRMLALKLITSFHSDLFRGNRNHDQYHNVDDPANPFYRRMEGNQGCHISNRAGLHAKLYLPVRLDI